MELRTKIEADPARQGIDYDTPVLFTGSCFAGEIGRQFIYGKMDVLINPFGVLYNPYSTARALEIIMEGRLFEKDDLYYHNNKYLSFLHDTSFSSGTSQESIDRINSSVSQAHSFLSGASFLFITFGTAWVYRWKDNNEIVANCHKIPAAKFTRQLLDVEDIFDTWSKILSKLKKFNPSLKIVFTVSPVRHLKDGAHGNQLSKSILIIAINKLLSSDKSLSYFPSYEIVLDELRDYRFYSKDMVHPSETAIEYIWEIFREVYFKPGTNIIYEKIAKITEATRHRISGNDPYTLAAFRNSMLQKIEKIKNDYPFVDMGAEEKYFNRL
ncbi:MAG TPA: GSCFA domain protein [Bacteroidales bacterium]|nr:GSCFA domain protein [Bacteroidales bacterium]